MTDDVNPDPISFIDIFECKEDPYGIASIKIIYVKKRKWFRIKVKENAGSAICILDENDFIKICKALNKFQEENNLKWQ